VIESDWEHHARALIVSSVLITQAAWRGQATRTRVRIQWARHAAVERSGY
jgi:hypothetical protein